MRIVRIALIICDLFLIFQVGELSLGNQARRLDVKNAYECFHDDQTEKQSHRQGGNTKQNRSVPAAFNWAGAVLTGRLLGRLIQGSFDLVEGVSKHNSLIISFPVTR